MNIKSIENYVQQRIILGAAINIHFKGRLTVTGLFIRSGDYEELKSKNFWRIVHQSQLQKWRDTNDINLTRVFYGASFKSLSAKKT